MKENNMLCNKILGSICVFLAVLLIVSFTPLMHSAHREKKIQSALLNKKYTDMIKTVTVSEQGSLLVLSKTATGWEGSCTSGLQKTVFPVQAKTVDEFITKLIKIRTMYIISDTVSFTTYNNKSNINVAVLGNNNNMYTKIYINTQTSPQNRLILSPEHAKKVYECDDDLSAYLTADPQLWCDPYLVPQELFGKITAEDVQRVTFIDSKKGSTIQKKLSALNAGKLLELRHGRPVQLSKAENPDEILRVETGNGSIISLLFYRTVSGDDGYTVTYDAGLMQYSVQLSSWTYEKMVSLIAE